jgi:hypothetical protein
MRKFYYDVWYYKTEELNLEGKETDHIAYEINIEVFEDKDHFKKLDDIRISGLDIEEMLSFKIHEPKIFFDKLNEEGLGSIVENIKETGLYTVMGDTVISLGE